MLRALTLVGLLAAFSLPISGAGAGDAKTAKKVVPAGPRFGKAVRGLQIAIDVGGDTFADGDPLVATITIKNVSKKKITLESHIATHETQLDWYTIHLDYPVPSDEGCAGHWAGSQDRVIGLDDDRDKSVAMTATLAPGATLVHKVDLRDWPSRQRNGAKRISPGFYKIWVEYEVKNEKGLWMGKIVSEHVPFTITGTIPNDMCQQNPGWDMF